jgi:inward rectifier potassium channel
VRVVGDERAPWEDLFHDVLTLGWTTFIGYAIALFIVTNFVFAGLYWLDPDGIANVPQDALSRFEHLFYFSVETMATVGYGGMQPVTRYCHVVMVAETMVGTLSTAMITGLTFAKFARPTARVLFAERLVVTMRDGVPHLMVRMANQRRNQVVEARVRLTLLRAHRSEEGDLMRVQTDVPLVRDQTHMFSLTWTAMHRIDEKSPFYGPYAMDRLRADQAQLLVSFHGLDATMGQTIHASTWYDMDDIVWNARYADVLHVDGTVRHIDYRRFHDIELMEPGGDA